MKKNNYYKIHKNKKPKLYRKLGYWDSTPKVKRCIIYCAKVVNALIAVQKAIKEMYPPIPKYQKGAIQNQNKNFIIVGENKEKNNN